jgi:predicted NBD/HSP70 family sugar kinase
MRAGSLITIESIAEAATHNDPLAMDLVLRSARALGSVLADLVNFYNPAKILLGGPLAHSNHSYLAVVREEVFRQAHPLATRPLTIDEAHFEESSGLRGAALMVMDELLSRNGIAKWINLGTPVAAFEGLAISS